MKKKDQILLENAYEQVASGSQYYVYDVMVSGMNSEVTMVTDTYTVPALSIKDAQTKALNNYIKEVGEVDEFVEIVPAKSNDVGIVNTSEESMLIISKNKLSEDQINDIVYQDPADEHEGMLSDEEYEDQEAERYERFRDSYD